METRILGLHTAVPEHHGSQAQVARFMSRVIDATATGRARERALALVDRVYSRSGIRVRHGVLTDFVVQDPARFTFFPPRWDLEPFPTTGQRMALYESAAVDLAARTARGALESCGVPPELVTHLVVCTCTGLFAPGPDIALVRRLDLDPAVSRTVIGFMGCYAGLTGLRLADQILGGNPDAVVLQVSIELCSIHFQKRIEPDLIVANSLFGDGCAAVVYGGADRAPADGIATVKASRCRVMRDTLDQMSWRVGDHGFEMRLSATVPAELRPVVPALVEELLDVAGVRRDEIRGWALHPGGRAIVEGLRNALRLEDDDVAASFDVLTRFGNMSSPTVFFVLDGVFRARNPGDRVVALGFGPGLTIEAALLETR